MLAALGVFLRDIGQITGFLATALLFASAIMYPPAKLAEQGFAFLRFNPFVQIVDLGRQSFLWHQPPTWSSVGYIYLVGLVVFVVGAVFFSLLRKSFAEVV